MHSKCVPASLLACLPACLLLCLLCLFDFGDGVYLEKYKPDAENIDADGTINDLLGKTFKYTCEECPGKKPRPMGYKEFTTHMAHQHGGLEEILSEHKEPKLRDLVKKMK